MSVETEIIEIRQKYKQALRDFTVINNDNKALLLMIFVLVEGLEYYKEGTASIIDTDMAIERLNDFQILWKDSGRQGTYRTGVQN